MMSNFHTPSFHPFRFTRGDKYISFVRKTKGETKDIKLNKHKQVLKIIIRTIRIEAFKYVHMCTIRFFTSQEYWEQQAYCTDDAVDNENKELKIFPCFVYAYKNGKKRIE